MLRGSPEMTQKISGRYSLPTSSPLLPFCGNPVSPVRYPEPLLRLCARFWRESTQRVREVLIGSGTI